MEQVGEQMTDREITEAQEDGLMSEEAQSDPTMRMMPEMGITPSQEAFLTLAYPDDEMTGELLANLPDFFFDLPKTDPNEDS